MKNAPVPLRSEEFPRGIPDELDRLSSKSRKRLDADTEMADLAAKSCAQADLQTRVSRSNILAGALRSTSTAGGRSSRGKG